MKSSINTNPGWFTRLIRWALECRHEWYVTGVNGCFSPREEQCCKCGMYRHRIDGHAFHGRAEWVLGRHPKASVKAAESSKSLADNWEASGFREVAELIRSKAP
jgi:hypothetical protein